MIECVITIDYEIYGNGEGSLKELIYEPAERLMAMFQKWNLRFVGFIEVAELEMIEAERADAAIELVKQQIRAFNEEGFEIGLHIHPQWYNGQHENGKWVLDNNEYNLCTLPKERVSQIVDRSIGYLRRLLGDAGYRPLCFRAGNWLFQPSQTVADVLAKRGVKVDSSVFKGGVQREHKLDYRRSLGNGYFWKFDKDVNVPDPNGRLLEIPIHTEMVPSWKMLTGKRLKLQRKASGSSDGAMGRLYRIKDRLRFRHPLKFDFCRMTLKELTTIMDAVIEEDEQDPTLFKPLVAIGHTKDLADFATVESFLGYLKEKGIMVSTFKDVYDMCLNTRGS